MARWSRMELRAARGVASAGTGLFLLLAGAPSHAADVVEYYHLDAIGNVRAVTNAAGQVVERHDYLPFGEECTTGSCASNPGLNAGQPRKFTGKERDAETGLDYFGARYYGSKIGRFTTTDPAYTIQENLLDPQRWNRYAYARNNPLRYVDPDGKWPTEVHNRIISQAFPGLSGEQIQVLQRASYNTDYTNRVNGRDAQDPANSFVHSMSDGVSRQAPPDAERQAQRFIEGQEAQARAQQADFEQQGGKGLSPEALTSFGNALHTVTDAMSPTHTGYQPWMGTSGLRNKAAALAHVSGEMNPSQQQRANAVGAARGAFASTFGGTRLREATTERKP